MKIILNYFKKIILLFTTVLICLVNSILSNALTITEEDTTLTFLIKELDNNKSYSVIDTSNNIAVNRNYSIYLPPNEEITLTLEIKKINSENEEEDVSSISWQTSNKKVATISENTIISENSPGKAIISGSYKKKKIQFSVITPKIKISLDKQNIALETAGTDTISVSGFYYIYGDILIDKTSDFDSESVIWATSNANIATVASGEVTALRTGKCKIYLYYNKQRFSIPAYVTSSSSS